MPTMDIDTYKSVLEDLTYIMKWLTNILHFLQFRITLQINLLLKEVDNNEDKELRKALAFVYMKYFYDLLSHLEYELQHIRNNANGSYVLNYNVWFEDTTKVVPNYYSYLLKKFRTNEYENADDYYGNKNNKFGKKLQDVKNKFYDIYAAIDQQFQDTKKSLNNYIGYIRQYLGIRYEIKYNAATKMYNLLDGKRRPYPNHTNFLFFNTIMMNILKFATQFRISINYNPSDYHIPKIPNYCTELGLGYLKETKIDYGYFDIDLIKIWDKVAIAIRVVLDYNYDCLQKDMVVSNLKLKVIVIL